ncbi:MAG TPA: hypothetical protein VFR78_03875 [Pyrinomonadaceae bacterium]|nr:hypothetical protein [Pyrinomonadaceae bacterium]
MGRIRLLAGFLAFPVAVLLGTGVFLLLRDVPAAAMQDSKTDRITHGRRPYPRFEMQVLVDGRPLTEYYARGRTYVEALKGAEYELRVRNSSPERVAVALSVDGLNTIDAKHTSAWNASKWVIEPYETITINGWQMSSERARRFYFTNERDSYGAKLGQTANLGVISAVFFRERRHVRPVTQATPTHREDRQSSSAPKSKAAGEAAIVDEDYAATGIGRSVRHDVRWVDMELDSRAAAEVTIRYEFYAGLRSLGIVPKRSREDARGFSPEP